MATRKLGKFALFPLVLLSLAGILLAASWIGSLSSSAQEEERSPVPPTQVVPDYVVTVPFSGKTLHWTAVETSFLRNGPDPANGKTTTVESWVQVGGDNVPVRAHIVARFEDGSFYQERLITQDGTTIVFGPGYPTTSPAGTNNCKQSWPKESAVQLSGVLPAFLDPNKLAGSGWIPSSLLSANYPPPAIKVNASPEETIGTGESFTAWQTRETQDGKITTSQVQLDAMGRVVASSSQRVNSSGDIIAENYQVNSPIQVYASGPSLEDAFEFTNQSAEVCH